MRSELLHAKEAQFATRFRTDLSVIVPMYNEERRIGKVLGALETVAADLLPLSVEIVVVDDGSTDRSLANARAAASPAVRFVISDRNRGKGAAVRLGLLESHGHFVALHDADDEYDPRNIGHLALHLASRPAAVAVFGSRAMSGDLVRAEVAFRWGNRLLTALANLMLGTKLSDLETAQRVWRREAIAVLDLDEDRWGIDPLIVCLLARTGLDLIELPISYQPRGAKDGKKITYRDGLQVASVLYRHRIRFRRGISRRRRVPL